jgi:hypothetical protein
MAPTACTPPRTRISSAPPSFIAATIAGCGAPFTGGAEATTRRTPATFAVITDIWAEATIGNLPPGT